VSPDGSTWSPIGRTLGQVETASIEEVGGSYLVIAKGTNDFFVPTQQWADAPAGQAPELLGRSIQLVRPAGIAAVMRVPWLGQSNAHTATLTAPMLVVAL
jgi:hypothetical protein